MRIKETWGRSFRFVKSHPVAFLLLLTFGLYFITRLIHLRSVPVFIDEAIYWRWARDAQEGSIWASLLWDGKPPLHAWMMAPFLAVFKDPLFAIRMTSVFFGALTTLGMVLLGKELKDLRFGAYAALLYTICPYTLWFDRMAMTESMLLTFYVLSVYFAVKAARSVNSLYLVGAGISLGLALLTKGTAKLLYPVVPFAYVIRGPREKGAEKKMPLVRWLAAVALSLLLGFAIFNLLRFSPKYHLGSHFISTRTKSLAQILDAPFEGFVKIVGSILYSLLTYMTPILLAMAFIGLVLCLWKRWRPGYFLCIWFLIPCAIIPLIGRYAWPRFYLVLVPPLLFTATYAISESIKFLAKARKSRQVTQKAISIVASIAIACLLLGIGILVGWELKGMIQAEQGIPCFLGGLNAGWGTDETVDFLERESQDRKITVGVDHYFIELALEMYLGDNPNVEIMSFDDEFKKGSPEHLPIELEKAALERPTYFVLNRTRKIPASWPLEVIYEFQKDKAHMKGTMHVTRIIVPRCLNRTPLYRNERRWLFASEFWRLFPR